MSNLTKLYVSRELSLYKKVFESGNEVGLYDALSFCFEHSLQIPEWILRAAIERQAWYIKGDNKRHAKWIKQYRQDLIDHTRAIVVKKLRDKDIPWKQVYEKASKILRGTKCGGSPSTIEGGYKRYKRRNKVNKYRYFLSAYLTEVDFIPFIIDYSEPGSAL